MYDEQIKFNGKSLVVTLASDADQSVFREIFVEREYRILEPIIVRAVSSAGALASAPILDIGAHKGFFSLYMRTLNPAVLVFAFEPESKNFAAMKENLKRNHVDGVVCKNLAVVGEASDLSGSRILYLSEDSHNHSLINYAGDSQKDVPGNGTQTVQTISLERIFEKYRLEKVAIVKMDCEGAEFEILENLSPEIARKITCFYIEYHEYKEGMKGAHLADLLRKFGFKVDIRFSHYDKKMGFILAQR